MKKPTVNEHNLSPDDIVNQLSIAGEKNETVEILKELFDKNKLNLITDLSPDMISLVTRMSVIASKEVKDIPQWREGLKLFMELRISNKRQSRTELIKAIGTLNMQKKQGLFGMNREL